MNNPTGQNQRYVSQPIGQQYRPVMSGRIIRYYCNNINDINYSRGHLYLEQLFEQQWVQGHLTDDPNFRAEFTPEVVVAK